MKSKIKMILISMIIICLIILIFLLQNIANNENKQLNNENGDESILNEEEAPTLYTDTTIHELTSTSILLALQDCVNTYYKYNLEGDSNAIYNIITTEYISSNNISKANVFEKFTKINQETYFWAKKVYEKELSFDHVYRYYVYGDSYSLDYKKIDSNLFVIDLDTYNLTYSIVPYGSVENSKYNTIINNLISKDNGAVALADTNEVMSIDSNTFNSFEIKSGDTLTLAILNNYFNYYYFLEVNDKAEAYNLLNEEYRSKRFGNESNYYEYIKNNLIKDIDFSYIKLYYENNGTKKYVGIDSNGKYYIAIESSPMNYKVMLDSYTIISQETIDKYESSSIAEKTCMCLELVKEMINNKDYSTMYNYLNSSFKSKYFSNVNSLKKFIEDNYYENTNFRYYNMKENSDNTYTVNLAVEDQNNAEYMFETNFIIKLGNDINSFELSFDIS